MAGPFSSTKRESSSLLSHAREPSSLMLIRPSGAFAFVSLLGWRYPLDVSCPTGNSLLVEQFAKGGRHAAPGFDWGCWDRCGYLAALNPLSAKVPVIGFLGVASLSTVAPVLLPAFLRGLGEAGYSDGQNVRIEYLWADGLYDEIAGPSSRVRPKTR